MKGRRSNWVRGLIALVLAASGGWPAAAEEAQAVVCTFDGVTRYDTDITIVSVDFTYVFEGVMQCESDRAGHPKSGSIRAGGSYVIGGVEHTLPSPAGHGGCAVSDSAGVAVIDWADGSRSVMSFDTHSVTGAGILTGRVVSGVVAEPAGGGTPAHIATTRAIGYHAAGSFGFEADPTDCVEGGRTAGIHGITTLRPTQITEARILDQTEIR